MPSKSQKHLTYPDSEQSREVEETSEVRHAEWLWRGVGQRCSDTESHAQDDWVWWKRWNLLCAPSVTGLFSTKPYFSLTHRRVIQEVPWIQQKLKCLSWDPGKWWVATCQSYSRTNRRETPGKMFKGNTGHPTYYICMLYLLAKTLPAVEKNRELYTRKLMFPIKFAIFFDTCRKDFDQSY